MVLLGEFLDYLHLPIKSLLKHNESESIQDEEQKIEEGQVSEFIGIINYSLMALIQLELGIADQPDLNPKEQPELYEKHLPKPINS